MARPVWLIARTVPVSTATGSSPAPPPSSMTAGSSGASLDGRRGRERPTAPGHRGRGVQHDGQADRLRGPALVAQRDRVGRGEQRAAGHAPPNPSMRPGSRPSVSGNEPSSPSLSVIGLSGSDRLVRSPRPPASAARPCDRLHRVHCRVEGAGDCAGGVGDVAQRAGEVAEADVAEAAEVVETRRTGSPRRGAAAAGSRRARSCRRTGRRCQAPARRRRTRPPSCPPSSAVTMSAVNVTSAPLDALPCRAARSSAAVVGQQHAADHDAMRPPPDLLVHGAVETGDPLLGEALVGLLAQPLHGGELEVVDHRRRHVTPRCRGRRTPWRAGRRGGRPRRRPARRAGLRRRWSPGAAGAMGSVARAAWSAHGQAGAGRSSRRRRRRDQRSAGGVTSIGADASPVATRVGSGAAGTPVARARPTRRSATASRSGIAVRGGARAGRRAAPGDRGCDAVRAGLAPATARLARRRICRRG